MTEDRIKAMFAKVEQVDNVHVENILKSAWAKGGSVDADRLMASTTYGSEEWARIEEAAETLDVQIKW